MLWTVLACERPERPVAHAPEPTASTPTAAPIDADDDGFPVGEDCDDDDPDVNPTATEIPCNRIDDDCDGRPSIAGCVLDPTVASETFAVPSIYFARGNVVPDLDGDELDDLVLSSSMPTEAFVLSGRSGSGAAADLAFSTVYADGSEGIVVGGAFDDEPGNDLLVNGNLFSSGLNPPVAQFLEQPFDNLWVSCVGDWNGDGIDGVALSGITNGARVSERFVADGPFSGTISIDDLALVAHGSPMFACAGDTNGNGRDEWVVILDEPILGQSPPLLYDGDGTSIVTLDPAYTWTAAGDADGDGFSDLHARQSSDEGCEDRIVLGPFAGEVDIDAQTWLVLDTPCPTVFPVGDLDGDGGTDFVAVNPGKAAYAWLGSLSGSFDWSELAEEAVLTWPESPLRVTVGEVDGRPGVDLLGSMDRTDFPLYLDLLD